MNTSKSPVFLGVLIATLCACAYRPQVISINPIPTLSTLDPVADNTRHDVILTTSDGRSSQEIGRRWRGTPKEATITTRSNISSILQSEMSELLRAKGYRAVDSGEATLPSLDLQLKELTYETFHVGNQRKLKIQAVLETSIKNGSKTYRNTFRAEQERKIIFEPVAKSNEEWINETLADAFKEIAKEPKIYSYLQQ